MLWLTTAKVAIKALLANTLRSFLAVLGIIIGVAAVIAMLALGAGAEQQVLGRITAMGTNLLIVRPGMRGGSTGVRTTSEQTLTLADAEALLALPGVKQVAPVVRGGLQVKRLDQNARVSVFGSSANYCDVRSFEIEKGRAFTDGEVQRAAAVCVLGPSTVEALFVDGSDPIGEVIHIKGLRFEVVGVTKAKGDQGWFNPDDQALVPYTIAMKQLHGVDYLAEIDIQAADGAEIASVEAAAAELLRKRHRLQPGQPDDFNVRNQAELVDTASSVAQTFKLLLGGIAAISLVVGGIGIMNIMLVTVTERTREIGVRKAIGARERDIHRQFLIEAILMSGIGGVLGAGFGIAAAEAASAVTGFAAEVEPGSVAMALGFSIAVGVFFGWAPARRASRLDPIEALRYE